ncbi:unnamed protein product [Vicia faba]|uniref:Uncharacterized protein n=1 Tax=Vicia faba TaxID=3906 RepID=A0AAV0YE95_VICFA|nr:unnamed protein product [Vicia faba]
MPLQNSTITCISILSPLIFQKNIAHTTFSHSLSRLPTIPLSAKPHFLPLSVATSNFLGGAKKVVFSVQRKLFFNIIPISTGAPKECVYICNTWSDKLNVILQCNHYMPIEAECGIYGVNNSECILLNSLVLKIKIVLTFLTALLL